ncbi:MAG: VWA domain-containing protein [Selenomonadaceae bacterium]|nr:VWA domain-containing protein [Selenomonadaceae bacterium]
MADIYNFTSDTIITGTADADSIYNSSLAANVTIDSDGGDDYVGNSGDSVTIDTGSGRDSIYNGHYHSSSIIGGNNVSINSGNGDDYISNLGDSVNINSGDGNDTIYNDSVDSVNINSGRGNDTILNDGNNATIVSDAGKDFIHNSGNIVAINSGDDSDRVLNAGESVTINAAEGDDSIYNYGASNVTIYAGDGNDTINNYGSSVTIDAGDGDNYISNLGDSVNINSGDGNDSIYNGLTEIIDADGITHSLLPNITSISSGAGNDYIRNDSGENVTINAGAGDDSIILWDIVDSVTTTSVLIYKEGDGNDTVSIASSSAQYTLQVESESTPTSVNSGDNLVVQVGTGSITFLGQANHTLNIVDPDGTPITLGGDTNTTVATGVTLANATPDILFEGSEYTDSLRNDSTATNVTIRSYGDSDTIVNYADSVTVDTGDGDDLISNNGSNVYITTGDGSDTISIGSDVTSVVLADLDTAADVLVFESAIAKGSLIETVNAEGALVLSSERISIVWQNAASLTNEILNYTVQNGSGTNKIRELIYTPAEINSVYVNLNSTTSATGVFQIPSYNTLANPTAEFTTDTATSNEIVGEVTAEKVYTAENTYAQNLTVTNGWNATATNLDDTINAAVGGNSSSKVSATVNAGDGNDLINASAMPAYGILWATSTLIGGTGDDTINIFGNTDGIHPSTVLVDGGADEDFISIYGGNNGIHGGTNGLSESEKSSVSIDGGDGGDQIFITGGTKGIDIANVKINGGAGNDLVSIYGGENGIAGWTEHNSGSTVSIDGGAGADTIAVNSIDSLSGVTIVAGEGDFISVGSGGAVYYFDSTNGVTINGATFTASSINTSASLETDDAGISIKSEWSGTVAISGENSISDITGSVVSSAGSYRVVDGRFVSTVSIEKVFVNLNSATSATGVFYISEGNTLSNPTAEFSTDTQVSGEVVGNVWENKVYDAEDEYPQSISVAEGWQVTATSLNDTVQVNGDSVTVDAGDGNNSIINFNPSYYGKYSYILTGSGEDTVHNYGDSVTIDTGAGNDSISNRGSNVTIDSGDGANCVNNYGNSATIQSGADNDSIRSTGDSTKINSGAGTDTIHNYGDSVTIDAGAGDDSIGNGGIVNSEHSSLSPADTGGYVVIDAGDGNDTVGNNGNYVTINGGSGIDVIGNVGVFSSVLGGDGNDSVYNIGANVTLDGGSGDDTISNGFMTVAGGESVYMNGGAGRDFILNTGTNVTINPGDGNDSIVFGADSTNLLIYSDGDDNDTVSVAGSLANSTLQINSSLTATSVNSGEDLVVQVGDGSITFLGQANGSLNVVDPEGNALDLTGGSSDTSSGGTDTGLLKYDTDIVFIVDTSGSMGTYITNVKNALQYFADSLKKEQFNFRLGLVDFGYSGNGDKDIKVHGFASTNNVEEFKTALEGLTASGGDEYGLSAIEAALTMDLNGDVTTRFIMLTDEDYDDTDTGTINLESDTIIDELNSRRIVLDVVGVTNSECEYDYKPLANATGVAPANGNFYDINGILNDIFKKIAQGIVAQTTDVFAVDLGTVPESEAGVFIVNSSVDAEGNTVFDSVATFKNEADSDDTVIGTVTSGKSYTADTSEEAYRQSITIPSAWNVTGTEKSDNLKITGNNVTVAGAGGIDIFSVGSGVSNVTFADFTLDEDKIHFTDAIREKSLRERDRNGMLTLYSRDRTLTFQNLSTETDGSVLSDFHSYRISNGGTSTSIESLLFDGADYVIVDLDSMPADQTGYVVIPALNTDKTPTASLNADYSEENEQVGLVKENKVYVADDHSDTYEQKIFVPDDWDVTGTENDDTINVIGDRTTISGNKGSDEISIGSGVRHVIIADLDLGATVETEPETLEPASEVEETPMLMMAMAVESAAEDFEPAFLLAGAAVETEPETLEPASEVEETPMLMMAMAVESTAEDFEPAFLLASAAVESEPTFLLAASEDETFDAEESDTETTATVAAATVQPDKDTLIFADRIDKDSLVWTFDPEAVTLASDDLEIVLYGVTELSDDVLNYEITSGGVTNKIQDLLKVTVDEVTVNLDAAADSTGSFYISEYNLESSATAVFGGSTGSDDTVIGTVTEEKVYAADSDSVRQIINVAENWQATATDKNDRLNVNGSATIASGGGTDTISVAGGVNSVTFADFDTSDRLIFDERIEKGSMLQTVEGGSVTIYSDEMSITWQGVDSLTNEILDYSFSNGSTRATIAELLVPDTIVAVDLETVPESETGEFVIVDYANDTLQNSEFFANDGSAWYNGHRYKVFSDVNLTWDEAKAYAESLGGHLVTITDKGEQAALETLLKAETAPKNSYWLGGYREGSVYNEGWQWLSGETIPAGSTTTLEGAAYSNWSYLQPDGDGSINSTALMLYYNRNYYSKFGQWNDFFPSGVNGQDFFGVENIGLIVEWDTGEENVGTVSSDKVYDAETGSEAYRQAITVDENWLATATNGDDSINVIGDNATVVSGGGRDTISIGRGVETVTFADIDTTADKLIFTDKIAENSLLQTVGENEVTLASDNISLVWQGTGTLTDSILNYSVNNGGDTNTILDLLEVQVEQVTVELDDVPTGYFVVANGNKNSLPTAEFEVEREIRGTIVGSVTTENFYVADTLDSAYRQNIKVSENWYANGTAKDDFVNVNGDNTTIASGLGNDTISVAGGVSSITLTDFDTAADILIFNDRIAKESLKQEAGEDFVNLVSDDFSMTWRGVSELTDDILGYEILNGRTRNTIGELLAPVPDVPVPGDVPVDPDDVPTIDEVVVNPDASMTIAFSHWRYGFNLPNSEAINS